MRAHSDSMLTGPAPITHDRFGGPGLRKQTCVLRKCHHMELEPAPYNASALRPLGPFEITSGAEARRVLMAAAKATIDFGGDTVWEQKDKQTALESSPLPVNVP